MQRTAPTTEQIGEWKRLYREYKDRLEPNRKTGTELVGYLRSRYELVPFHDDEADEVVAGSVTDNLHFREKLPAGGQPCPVTFYLTRGGNRVFIGVDLASGMYHIEDDEELFDELCAFQGLDKADLENFFCVAQYILALKKFGKLKSVLKGFHPEKTGV